MIWSLDQDDYTGVYCRQGPFPITRRVHDIIFSSNKYSEQDFFTSTKFRTKPTISFVPIQIHTSQQQRKSTSTLKAKNSSVNVKNSSTLYLLFILLFLI